MKQNLIEAIRELNRLEHLIYVSLKYTRTTDILKTILDKMITILDYLWNALLEKKKLDKVIEEYSSAPLKKVEMIKELYEDERIRKMINFYLLLKKLNKLEYIPLNEYRKQLTMRFINENNEIYDITIESVTNDYKEIKDFLSYLRAKYLEI